MKSVRCQRRGRRTPTNQEASHVQHHRTGRQPGQLSSSTIRRIPTPGRTRARRSDRHRDGVRPGSRRVLERLAVHHWRSRDLLHVYPGWAHGPRPVRQHQLQPDRGHVVRQPLGLCRGGRTATARCASGTAADATGRCPHPMDGPTPMARSGLVLARLSRRSVRTRQLLADRRSHDVLTDPPTQTLWLCQTIAELIAPAALWRARPRFAAESTATNACRCRTQTCGEPSGVSQRRGIVRPTSCSVASVGPDRRARPRRSARCPLGSRSR
jgi:hypothetical protein